MVEFLDVEYMGVEYIGNAYAEVSPFYMGSPGGCGLPSLGTPEAPCGQAPCSCAMLM